MRPHVDVLMYSSDIEKGLQRWIDECLPIDIKVRRGTKMGVKVVCFSVYGETQEDIVAKWNALEKVINGARR